jgi:hypothetical protein
MITDGEMASKLENSLKTTAPIVPAMSRLLPVVLEAIVYLRRDDKDKVKNNG